MSLYLHYSVSLFVCCSVMMCLSSLWLVLCVICLSFCFFFFKQKTAYEMRISDWSSDVCSSDLGSSGRAGTRKNGASAVFPPVPTSTPRCRTAPSEIGRASCRERVCQYV